MRFWNIGAEGQVLVGCLATAACMICPGRHAAQLAAHRRHARRQPSPAGALWGFIPAFFKAKWNTNETLFTLMMNYVAIQLVAFFIIIWECPTGSGKVGIINQQQPGGLAAHAIGGQQLPAQHPRSSRSLTVVMYVYLKYSKHGYEIAVVGESERTARYVGIKVERVIMRTMIISGAICGLAGFLLVGRHRPHDHHHHRRRPRLHSRHGLLAGQVQPHRSWCSPAFLLVVPEPRRERDRHRTSA